MELRHHPAIKGNGNLNAFRADWRQLLPDPLNDLRDLTTPENRAHIEALKASIRERGVRDPLEIRYDGKTIFVTNGRCRLTALAELRAEGFDEIETVLTIPEARGLDEAERTAGILVTSTLTKNYDRLEVGAGIQRLIGFGWSPEKVAKRMGWASVKTVEHHLQFAELPTEAKQAVSAGTVSATAARKLVEKHGADAPAILKQATEAAQAKAGDGEAVKVKPRDIKAAEPKPVPTKVVEREADAIERRVAAEHPDAAPKETPDLVKPETVSAQDGGDLTNELIEALRPVARSAMMFDFEDEAINDDAVVPMANVTVGDLKTIWNLWFRLRGEETP